MNIKKLKENWAEEGSSRGSGVEGGGGGGGECLALKQGEKLYRIQAINGLYGQYNPRIHLQWESVFDIRV